MDEQQQSIEQAIQSDVDRRNRRRIGPDAMPSPDDPGEAAVEASLIDGETA